MDRDFQLTTSFTKRLRRILIIIAAFFLIGVASSYLSSQDFLYGVQNISTANRILNYTTLSLESLDTSEQVLEKINTGSSLRNVKFSFDQSYKLAHQNLQEAVALAAIFPEAQRLVQEAGEAFGNYRTSVNRLFELYQNNPSGRMNEELKSEAVVVREFSADARETMRMAQINLKEQSDQLFTRIYNSRFRPLLVATVLSVFFFSFVIIVGFSTARRLGQALSNLGSATSAVGKGDLDYHAPILENDEFGKLTHEFNSMVNSLQTNQQKLNWAIERVTRLQHITSAFSEAMVPGQVFEVLFKEAFDILDVNSGAVGLLDGAGENVHLQRVQGYTDVDQDSWSVFPLTIKAPITDAILTAQPVYLSNMKETQEQYPNIYAIHSQAGISSTCALPLIVENKAIGGLVLSFAHDKEFSLDEREFISALVNQCSQALHRSQLYEAAKEAIKVRDEFLSIASHELRTPLTPLKLQLQHLSRQIKKSEGVHLSGDQILRAVQSSNKQVNRLTSLIDDLLDVSRISAGKLTLNREVFNLGEMVEEVVGHYTHQLKEINSLVEVEVEEDLLGNFDKVRIEQVFINLLTNAAKYAPGKPIKVNLKNSEDYATLTVQDQGQGIADLDQKRIFERFERVQDRDNVGGLGLGLYISRQIVEAHEGHIRVESIPGNGASFIVELPLWKES